MVQELSTSPLITWECPTVRPDSNPAPPLPPFFPPPAPFPSLSLQVRFFTSHLKVPPTSTGRTAPRRGAGWNQPVHIFQKPSKPPCWASPPMLLLSTTPLGVLPRPRYPAKEKKSSKISLWLSHWPSAGGSWQLASVLLAAAALRRATESPGRSSAPCVGASATSGTILLNADHEPALSVRGSVCLSVASPVNLHLQVPYCHYIPSDVALTAINPRHLWLLAIR